MPLVLGVDSSTQATKVEVRDADNGRLVASGRASHPSARPPRSEQNPVSWWHALASAVAETGEREIAAISVAGQQHGMVALDKARNVLRPAKLWNDIESAPESEAMIRKFGAQAWARACGSVPVASFTITKLAWLASHEPEVMARLGTVLLPHDYLTFRLTGRLVTDRGDASGTGYWSPLENRWQPDLLRRVVSGLSVEEWEAKLPEVLGPRQPSDWVSASVWPQLGLRGRPLVGPGTGDNMAAALALGLAPGDVAVSIGTSGTVCTVSPKPVADPTGAVAGFADATGRFLPLMCTLNATLVTEAFARLLGVDHDRLAELALATPPGARGVVLLPYLDGERTPNKPNATGILGGLRSDVEPGDVARAAFEAVACSLLEGLDALRATGSVGPRPRIYLVGGGARSLAYRRIFTDMAGLPVIVPEEIEPVAAGACVQAAAVLHDRAPEEVAAAWALAQGPTVEPDAGVDRERVRAAIASVRR